MSQSTVYLRRSGYNSEPNTIERVIHDIYVIDGIQFGSYKRGTMQYCIRGENSKKDEWYTVPGSFPLLRKYEIYLESLEEE